MAVEKKIKYKDQRLTKAQQKKAKPVVQAGTKNFLGKQEMVTVPKKWLSSSDHVVAELAYITPKEQKILIDKNLYGSLKGKPNVGPGGIMSLQGGDAGGLGGDGPSGNDGDPDNNREQYGAVGQYSGPPSSSSPKGDDNDYNYKGPADLGVTTRTVNTIDPPEAKEFIGGVAYDVTPATKAIRERARVKQAILNPTVKKNTIFDPISKNFINPFAPTVTKKTPWERTKQLLSIASVLSPHTLVGKIGLGLTTYDRAKTGLQAVSSIADTFGINTDSITNSLSNNFSGKKSNTTTNTNNGGDGEGLASLENQAGSYDEYILLLQKLQSGNISDSERNRYNVLKNMLGI